MPLAQMEIHAPAGFAMTGKKKIHKKFSAPCTITHLWRGTMSNTLVRSRFTQTKGATATGFIYLGMAALLLFSLIGGCKDTGTPIDTPPPAAQEDGVLYIVAGTDGVAGNDGDEGPATSALLYWPHDMTPMPNGDLIVVDWNNHRFRKITPDGVIHHFIASGLLGDVRKGDATTSRFNHPTELKVGPDGNYWIAAFHNWCLKEVDATTLQYIQCLGDTSPGYRGDYPEHGGSLDFAAKPRMNLPGSLTFGPDGILYFSDQGNTRIRKIDLVARVISTLVGGTRGTLDGIGTAAQFALPGSQTVGTGSRGGAIDISEDGQDLYMADTENNLIRKIHIADQMVTTIAGSGGPPGNIGYSGDGGPALSARLNYPQDIVVGNNGDIYFADSHNHVVRKIDAGGTITTVAGTGLPGSSPNGTPAHSAKMFDMAGVAFDRATNTLYIADTYNHLIRKVRNPQ
jgi:sugar lactone lactonase YvrE